MDSPMMAATVPITMTAIRFIFPWDEYTPPKARMMSPGMIRPMKMDLPISTPPKATRQPAATNAGSIQLPIRSTSVSASTDTMCTMRHSPTGGPMKADDVKTVGVIGAGIMGSGIVEVFAKSGLDVTFVEVDVAARDRGLAAIER